MQVAIASEGAINALELYRREEKDTLLNLEVMFAVREDPEVRAILESRAAEAARHEQTRKGK